MKRAIQKYEQKKKDWVTLVQKGQEEGLELWTSINEEKVVVAKSKQEVTESKQREAQLQEGNSKWGEQVRKMCWYGRGKWKNLRNK